MGAVKSHSLHLRISLANLDEVNVFNFQFPGLSSMFFFLLFLPEKVYILWECGTWKMFFTSHETKHTNSSESIDIVCTTVFPVSKIRAQY